MPEQTPTFNFTAYQGESDRLQSVPIEEGNMIFTRDSRFLYLDVADTPSYIDYTGRRRDYDEGKDRISFSFIINGAVTEQANRSTLANTYGCFSYGFIRDFTELIKKYLELKYGLTYAFDGHLNGQTRSYSFSVLTRDVPGYRGTNGMTLMNLPALRVMRSGKKIDIPSSEGNVEVLFTKKNFYITGLTYDFRTIGISPITNLKFNIYNRYDKLPPRTGDRNVQLPVLSSEPKNIFPLLEPLQKSYRGSGPLSISSSDTHILQIYGINTIELIDGLMISQSPSFSPNYPVFSTNPPEPEAVLMGVGAGPRERVFVKAGQSCGIVPYSEDPYDIREYTYDDIEDLSKKIDGNNNEIQLSISNLVSELANQNQSIENIKTDLTKKSGLAEANTFTKNNTFEGETAFKKRVSVPATIEGDSPNTATSKGYVDSELQKMAKRIVTVYIGAASDSAGANNSGASLWVQTDGVLRYKTSNGEWKTVSVAWS